MTSLKKWHTISNKERRMIKKCRKRYPRKKKWMKILDYIFTDFVEKIDRTKRHFFLNSHSAWILKTFKGNSKLGIENTKQITLFLFQCCTWPTRNKCCSGFNGDCPSRIQFRQDIPRYAYCLHWFKYMHYVSFICKAR